MPKKRPVYYHCSPNRLPVGTVLSTVIQRKVNFDYELPLNKKMVFMCDMPIVHGTITSEISCSEKSWFMYEICPIGKIEKGCYSNEYTCHSAEVIKFIGNVGKFGQGLHKKFVEGKVYSAHWINKKRKNAIKKLKENDI